MSGYTSEMNEALDALEGANHFLRFWIFQYLTTKIFASFYNLEDASSWAMAVLNTTVNSSPGNELAKAFYEKNEDKIWEAAKQLKEYPELNGPDGGISCLIFAKQFYLQAIRNDPQTTEAANIECATRAWELEERAKLLGIDTLSLREFTNSNEPIEIIHAICAKATSFRERVNKQ